MARNAKPGLPVTGGDVFMACFFGLFVVVGLSVLVGTVAAGEFSLGILLWSAMFIGIPLVMARFTFDRFFKLRRARKSGKPVHAKVVGKVADPSMTVNGRPVSDLRVRFMDGFGNVREETVDANQAGKGGFEVGSTVDLYEMDGEYVLGSGGYDMTLPFEAELMEARPAVAGDGGVATTHTATCPCCGRLLVIDERYRLLDASGGEGAVLNG